MDGVTEKMATHTIAHSLSQRRRSQLMHSHKDQGFASIAGRTDRIFIIENDTIELFTISKLFGPFSGSSIELSFSERKSMISVCKHLKNNTIAKMIFENSVGVHRRL
jgi:hypothetical protein